MGVHAQAQDNGRGHGRGRGERPTPAAEPVATLSLPHGNRLARQLLPDGLEEDGHGGRIRTDPQGSV